MSDPQQPTPEALTLTDELWWILESRGGDARQGALKEAAKRIDRFAAQCMTAAAAKARREAIEEAVKVVLYEPGQVFDVRRWLAERIRALSPAPQNPGDANER